MNAYFHLHDQIHPQLTPLLLALAWALIHFLWQACVLGVVTAFCQFALRNASPQTRYLSLNIAMLCAVLWPLSTFSQYLQMATLGVNSEVVMLGAATTSVSMSKMENFPQFLPLLMPYVLAVWMLGVSLLGLRFVLGLVWLQGYHSDTRSYHDPQLQACVDRLTRAFAMQGRVVIRVVDELSGPITIGCLRPLILVPGSLLTGMAPAHLEALLAHELAHIRRYDFVLNLLQNVIEIVLFFHPVIWWISKRIRDERENIADDLAVQVIGEPRRLALALQQLEHLQFVQSQLALAAHGGNLMLRIKRLVRPETHRMHWKTAVMTIGVAGVCVAMAAHATVILGAPEVKIRKATSDKIIVSESDRGDIDSSDVLPAMITNEDQVHAEKVDAKSVSNSKEASKPNSKVVSGVDQKQKDAKASNQKSNSSDKTQSIAARIDFGSSKCKPEYPRSSLRNEETGRSTYDVMVSESGQIKAVNVVKTSGFVNLDNAVAEKLMSGTCTATPGQLAGKKIATTARVEYVWKLD
ncbi:M56 family metallopeptidase [Undibacterium cyanobacteriorum]|uniref:M56 family metallopeptidase n=1 Tax=Undibacterium cyanobacteriorum TaxID=3073561 RepID=A0ABY9RFS3_9BURK|nr:M56 family metallopeptidase [Undibacterium sp. 20NA77.5]WMW78986.1 M56 family metallopeptidase [Undibacterium sp. 20NA77.5]